MPCSYRRWNIRGQVLNLPSAVAIRFNPTPDYHALIKSGHDNDKRRLTSGNNSNNICVYAHIGVIL